MTDTDKQSYSVVRLNKENLSDLARLHLAVYGKAVSPDFFPKKYTTAFTGVEYVGVIAYNDQQEPVGFYGVIPCFVNYNGKKYLAAQSADTMTHPKHRYKGLFVDLSNQTFALCRDSGIHLVFGFPNQHSYHGAVNKLGWQQTDTMSFFIIPVNASLLARLGNRYGFLQKTYKAYCRWVLKNFILDEKGVQNSSISDGYGGVCRDGDYLEYKTYSPTMVINISGVKVWLSLRHYLMIGDMEGVTDANFSEVMNGLKRIASRFGKTQIQFHCSTGTRLHDLFASHFPVQPSYPVLFQDFGSPVPKEKIKFTFADIDIF